MKEKQLIGNPVCPNCCMWMKDATSQPFQCFRMYIEPDTFYVIRKLGSKYYWYNEDEELLMMEELNDETFSNFLLKSYNTGYPIRVVDEL